MQLSQLVTELYHLGSAACKLRLSLAYEVYKETRATALFPVNMLRNLARLQVGATLVVV